MDVHRASLIPPGINRRELSHAVGVSELIPAQKLLSDGRLGRDVRIEPCCVAVPYIYLRPTQGRASARADPRHLKREGEGHTAAFCPGRRIGGDVGAVEKLVDEVRALGLGGSNDA